MGARSPAQSLRLASVSGDSKCRGRQLRRDPRECTGGEAGRRGRSGAETEQESQALSLRPNPALHGRMQGMALQPVACDCVRDENRKRCSPIRKISLPKASFFSVRTPVLQRSHTPFLDF